MEKVYTPRERNIPIIHLKETVTSYLSGSHYDPRKSEMRAAEYKALREKAQERRKKNSEDAQRIFSSFQEIVKTKVRY